jgi:uncharacterized protein (DUF1330 family)
MTAYLVTDADWKDVAMATRREFIEAVNPVITRHHGKPLAQARAPESIEGDWHPPMLVIYEFPDADAVRSMLDSPEFQAAAAIRQQAGAVFKQVLLES